SLTTTTLFYARASNGQCDGNAISVSAVINPSPVVNIGPDTIYSSAASYLFDAGNGFAGYFWSPNNTGQQYSAELSGYYCVTVTDANNCTATDCVQLELPLGMNDELD